MAFLRCLSKKQQNQTSSPMSQICVDLLIPTDSYSVKACCVLITYKTMTRVFGNIQRCIKKSSPVLQELAIECETHKPMGKTEE